MKTNKTFQLKLIISILLLHFGEVTIVCGQVDTLTQKPVQVNADDPSQFLTRVEIFNEFQHYDRAGGFNLNQTVFRTIIKLGKRFTTRVDVPLVNNSFPYPQGYASYGLGDISFRLLGYRIRQTKRSAVTASLEISLNTASTPAQGAGKNMLIPLITYSSLLKDNKTIAILTFQQTNSFSGDEARPDYSFSKIQGIILHYWSRKMWSVVAPELFIDYINGGTSMILKGRMTFAPMPRMNIWVQANAGLYGDFIARYNWGAEAGARYFMVRAKGIGKTSN
ncbi:MAG: hypothetical protein IPP25_22120 [Saprospiraceae bacterium]|nr:hypothetical protein [Candidatus Opimibacter skivensis]